MSEELNDKLSILDWDETINNLSFFQIFHIFNYSIIVERDNYFAFGPENYVIDTKETSFSCFNLLYLVYLDEKLNVLQCVSGFSKSVFSKKSLFYKLAPNISYYYFKSYLSNVEPINERKPILKSNNSLCLNTFYSLYKKDFFPADYPQEFIKCINSKCIGNNIFYYPLLNKISLPLSFESNIFNFVDFNFSDISYRYSNSNGF